MTQRLKAANPAPWRDGKSEGAELLATVWEAVGRATSRVGGTRLTGFLGESYAIPDAQWSSIGAELIAELGPGWTEHAYQGDDPYCIVLEGPTQVFFLTSTRVTTSSGVARRLVLAPE